MHLPSKLLEDAVEQFAKLPGIGRKTALRLVLFMLKKDPDFTGQFGDAIIKMRREIQFCKDCGNVSDADLCGICNQNSRDRNTVCVVESIRDLLAIEATAQYNGLYHVLGGVISPIDGIGPEQLSVDSLSRRVDGGEIRELVMALPSTIEGDTTVFYITRMLEEKNVKVTTIARGVSFGGDLEYVDELTLGRSITSRLPYSTYLPDNE